MNMRPWLIVWIAAIILSPLPVTHAGQVQLCARLKSDQRTAQSPTTTFPAGTSRIVAVVKLDENEQIRTLGAVWIAVDAEKTVNNTELADDRVELGKDRTCIFRYIQPEPMFAGKYRVDFTADGKPWKSVQFTVRK